MRQASTNKVEHLAQDGHSVAAIVGHRGSWTDALPQAIPRIFHDAQRAQRRPWNRPGQVQVTFSAPAGHQCSLSFVVYVRSGWCGLLAEKQFPKENCNETR